MDDKLYNPFDIIDKRLRRIENLLSAVLQESQKQSNVHKFISKDKSIELAMAITGLKKKSIYNLEYKRLIPHSKKGKRLYFDETELTEWINKGKRRTLEELGLQ